MIISNPKRIKRKATQKESWFAYYAGFSAAFVRDAIEQLFPDLEGHLLDPWNGSGTTTTTSRELGINSTGLDINPVMIIVAKAKLLNLRVVESLLPLAYDVVAKARSTQCELCTHDPLLEWFAPSGARSFRSFEQSIRNLLTPLTTDTPLYSATALELISDLAAFYLVALFRTARSFLTRFQASNPTWIKTPRSLYGRVRPSIEMIAEEFLDHVTQMIVGIAPATTEAKTTISLGSSEHLPLSNNSTRAVIASPPYCTRIDYAVATKPELAVLGCPLQVDFDVIRRSMLGGPVVLARQPEPEIGWGTSVRRFLESVARHPTKGSKNYYHKLFTQYYGAIHKSLAEIDRTLVAGGHCVLVVQDSYYKEIHVDVPRYITEMATNLDWALEHRFDFEARQVMARLNPRAQKYRRNAGATESVLWFRSAS